MSREIRERERGEEEEERKPQVAKRPNEGWPPAPTHGSQRHQLIAVQVVQNRVPNVRFEVSPIVFVEAFSWPGTMMTYLKGLSNL